MEKNNTTDFKNLMEGLDNQIFWEIKLPEFTWEYVSPSVEKLRGYTVEEATRRSLEETLTIESFQIVSEKIRNELLSQVNGKDKQTLKLEHFCKDGSTKWFSVEISVVRKNGKPIKIIGASQNIENQEQRLIALEKKTKQLKKYAVKMNKLRKIIPICASCKKIRRDDNSWEQLESYISRHHPIDFSHGIYEDCTKKLYPELYDPEDFKK